MKRISHLMATLAVCSLQVVSLPASALVVSFTEPENNGLISVASDVFPFTMLNLPEEATFSVEIPDQGFGNVIVNFGATLLEPGTKTVSDVITGTLSTVTSGAGVKTTLVTLDFVSETNNGPALTAVGGMVDEVQGGQNIFPFFVTTNLGAPTPLSSIISFPFVVNVTSDIELPEPPILPLIGLGFAFLWILRCRKVL